MSTFFQAHPGDAEGVCSDHRNLKTIQLPHRLPATQLGKAQTTAFLSLHPVSFCGWLLSFAFVLGSSFVCLLFVCLDNPLEAGGYPSSLGVKWLPKP